MDEDEKENEVLSYGIPILSSINMPAKRLDICGGLPTCRYVNTCNPS